MSNLYELTRRLVALGCPEPDGLIYYRIEDDPEMGPADLEFIGSDADGWKVDDWDGDNGIQNWSPVWDCHASAIWEAHAREWAVREKGCIVEYTQLGVLVECGERDYLGDNLLDGIVTVLEQST